MFSTKILHLNVKYDNAQVCLEWFVWFQEDQNESIYQIMTVD